jgi:diacylglycerol O-acyltransferase
VELDGPVDDRRLAREVARVYSGMLDRRHPRWKLIILHGLPDDNTAVVWKVHHAMVDGVRASMSRWRSTISVQG